MAQANSFRIGKVTAYLRGRTWYLRYFEQGQRHQVRAGVDRAAVRQLAAQVNAQIESGAPAITSHRAMDLAELRRIWLDHHEHVLQSSVSTINRYRTATDHLMRFTDVAGPSVRHVARFHPGTAEQFVRYLRELEVAPNGHRNARRRPLQGKGILYILEVCRSLFNFAIKRRCMPPYADNPFSVIQIDRMPIEPSRPQAIFSPDEERRFLEACGAWELPIFLTLALTGLRPGELTHLLLPHDIDLRQGWLFVGNKPELGWRTKTRNERRIPLVPELSQLLSLSIGDRISGPVFTRHRFQLSTGMPPLLAGRTQEQLVQELEQRISESAQDLGISPNRDLSQRASRFLWRDMGAIKTCRLRCHFIRLAKSIGVSHMTAPKCFRHGFATCLQDANVDPLIRSQLMGHAPLHAGYSDSGLGMTGVYTHTRPETMRRQLLTALANRPAVEVARAVLQCQTRSRDHSE